MTLTIPIAMTKLYELLKSNAPVRNSAGPKGKPGTNMYSPYPGNLKNNGIVPLENGICYDYNKVGYIGYANIRSHKPQFIEKTIDDFCDFCVSLGGRIVKR